MIRTEITLEIKSNQINPNSNARCDGGGRASGDVLGGPAEEGEETSGSAAGFLIIKEEILGNPESAMNADDGDADDERRHKERSDAGEEDDEDGDDDEEAQGFLVGERPAEEDKGVVGGAEEVEEAPGGEECEEGEEREWVGQERESEHAGEEGQVVDPEVGVVLPEAGGCVGEGIWFGEGGPVDEFSPGAALREPVFDLVVEAADEGAERGGLWRGCGGCGGG